MKWNRFIVEQTSRNSCPPPRHDLSRHSSQGSKPTFTLKSIEKSRLNESSFQQGISPINDQENFKISQVDKVYSRESLQVEVPSRQKPQKNDKNWLAEEVSRIANVLLDQLENFLFDFFKRHDEIRIEREQYQMLKAVLETSFPNLLESFMKAHEGLIYRCQSPIKKAMAQLQSSSSIRQTNRAISFKNQKISQKEGIVEVFQNKILNLPEQGHAKPRQTRFERTASRRSKNKDRSFDSAESLLENSFNDSYRSSRSRLKAREALYQFSKVANQILD